MAGEQVYLDAVILQCENVEQTNGSNLFRQNTDSVFLILPPRHTEIIGKVTRWIWRCEMNESTVGRVGKQTMCHRIDVMTNLKAEG